MVNILLWGLGKKIDLILNILKRETNINILGIISRRQCFSYYDGIPMVTEDDIKEMKYDIILATDGNIIKSTGIEPSIREKIIDDRCLKIPGFKFETYLNIRRQKWCIVSEDCWGGMCYHYMQMPFTSPFINIDIPMEDYYRMLEDLKSYLKSELVIVREEDIDGYAKGDLGGVSLNLFHYRNGMEGKRKWEERLKRVDGESPFLIKKL